LATHYEAKVTLIHAFTPVSDILGEPNYNQALNKTMIEAASLVTAAQEQLRVIGCPMSKKRLSRGKLPPWFWTWQKYANRM